MVEVYGAGEKGRELFREKSPCIMCGQMAEPDYRYCADTCVTAATGFVSVATVGSTPKPHLHRKCKRCGYEWLMETVIDAGKRKLEHSLTT